MSKIEINFDTIKYNLYEILNVPSNSDETKIKKNFMKLIKNFHPDKNSDLEEDIYYHIILANQILLNKESRKKYDEFLLGKVESHIELKDSFKDTVKKVDKLFDNEEISKIKFEEKLKELNNKHGYNLTSNNESVLEKFNKTKNKRNNEEIIIEKEEIKNNDDFNKKFNSNKSDIGKFKNQIIELKENTSELSTYIIGDQYTNLKDLDKLYIEDSIQSNKFSSLDKAFMLQPNINNINNKSIEEKINEYKNQTEIIKKMKNSDFTNHKFEDWQ